MNAYTAVVERCSETGLYVGYVPGFRGAHSQAESLDDLHRNLTEVVEMLLEDGDPHVEVVIYRSAEDQLFIAAVPELPGCVAHGDSRAEALRNAEEAISLWIEAAQRRGRPIPKARGRRLMVA